MEGVRGIEVPRAPSGLADGAVFAEDHSVRGIDGNFPLEESAVKVGDKGLFCRVSGLPNEEHLQATYVSPMLAPGHDSAMYLRLTAWAKKVPCHDVEVTRPNKHGPDPITGEEGLA